MTTRKVTIEYVIRPPTGGITFGIMRVDWPTTRRLTDEDKREILRKRHPDAITSEDYIREVAAEEVARRKAEGGEPDGP